MLFTAEQEGLKDVAIAKYEKEVELVKATTKAREEFEVAEFATKEAAERKKATILGAEAIKQELMIADGLSAREKYQIDADVKRDIGVAAEVSKLKFPGVMVFGSGEQGSPTDPFAAVGLEAYRKMVSPAERD